MFENIANILDFTVNLSVFTASVIYGIKSWKAKKTRLDCSENNGVVWVVVQVGHPVAGIVKEQFKLNSIDYLIDPEVDVGKLILDTRDDYKKIIGKFRDILKANQHKEIRVVTSGPTALNALLGQIAGPSYHIVWYQWDLSIKNYKKIPSVAELL